MGCSGCSSGRGCSTTSGVPAGCNNNGSCGTGGGCNKLNVFNWLSNMQLPGTDPVFDGVEVRFKNSRKEFFKNVNNLPLIPGEVVAVEASPGHDIGTVSAVGEIARLQMQKKGVKPNSDEIKKLYRKAKQTDIDKWKEAQQAEHNTMHKARVIASGLKLDMKISDVEYQGDKTKAIFYYTADERVDFRELIKKLAEEFRVRIEMRQIGARQEASRLGGIGSCGRELCCSTWLTDFRTVTTTAARYQQLSLNPIKLAGQCGKLKCCLNYELDAYMDAVKDFPDSNINLHSKRGTAFHQKTDIFKRTMWYSYQDDPGTFIPLSVNRVKEVLELNARNEKPDELALQVKEAVKAQVKEHKFENVVGQDSVTRFDKQKKQGQHHKKNKGGSNQRPNNNRRKENNQNHNRQRNKPNDRKS